MVKLRGLGIAPSLDQQTKATSPGTVAPRVHWVPTPQRCCLSIVSLPAPIRQRLDSMASLFVVRGRDQGRHFNLESVAQRIGRDSNSDIQLLDSEASRNHAEIAELDDGKGYQVRDLGSSNGTRINGKSIKQQLLSNGDRIEIGQTLLIFTGAGAPATSDAAHGVDIVLPAGDSDASRIVSSLPQSSDIASDASEAQRSLEVIYLTAIAVGRGEDLETVLDRILRLVFDWVDADRGCIMLKDANTEKLTPAARCDRDGQTPVMETDDDMIGNRTANSIPKSRPLDRGERTVRRIPKLPRITISHTILDYVLERKEGVRTSDAVDDKRFEAAASIVRNGVREALCVPLQGRYGIVGALYVDTYTSNGQLMKSGLRERFTDEHLRLITAIGHQAALAIEDTYYYSAMLQSERLATMGQTIATLSHHVKNVLQGVRGGSYLIDAGLKRDDKDAILRGWKIVERNQERISNLVLDMLSFSKEREPERVEADVNETVADVVEIMQQRATEMGVVLGYDLAEDMPRAMFDPDGIHRAVLNLVTNAIDAASTLNTSTAGQDHQDGDDGQPLNGPAADGKVFVQTAFLPDEGWRIDVIDNGPGVPEDQREKIFSLFESNKGSSGTGLGLPVSAKIMREHGGAIEVVDSTIGTGSCFRLRLPVDGTHVSEISRQDTLQ